MAELSDGVALTELGVINRWSLAVRAPEAERAELIAELQADLAWLQSSAPSQAIPQRRSRGGQLAKEIVAQRDDYDYDDESVDGAATAEDTPEPAAATPAKPLAPLRRLPKPKPVVAAPAKVSRAPARRAPAKLTKSPVRATKVAPVKVGKPAAAKAVSAAPRGRRPAGG